MIIYTYTHTHIYIITYIYHVNDYSSRFNFYTFGTRLGLGRTLTSKPSINLVPTMCWMGRWFAWRSLAFSFFGAWRKAGVANCPCDESQ